MNWWKQCCSNERYVGKGVYMRRVEPEPEPEDVPPPLAAE